MTDRGVAKLRNLPKLRRLSLRSTDVTEDCISSIVSLTNLELLYLENTKLTPSILPKLKSLPKLRGLHIHNWSFTSQTARSLSELSTLQELKLNESWLSDEGVAALRQMKLVTLYIRYYGKLDDALLRNLTALSQLQNFGVEPNVNSTSDPGISPSGFRLLATLPRLRILSGINLPFTDEHLAAIAEITSLEILECNPFGGPSSPMTDTGLEHLARLPKLKQLTLMKTQVTPAGLTRFRAAKPDCQITTDVKEQAP